MNDDSTPEPTPKTRRIFGLTPLALGVVGALCLCSVTLYGGCFASFFSAESEAASATPLVDKFMRQMVARNAVAAEGLFSQDMDPYQLKSELDAMLTGANYALFDGYRSLNTEGYSFLNRQGCLTHTHTLSVHGIVSYENGMAGQFNAQLTRERDAWALLSVNVTVPPAKVLPAPAAP